MSKLLFWVVVILGLLLVSRLLARHAMRRRAAKPVAPRRQPPPARPPQSMVQCAHCGVHLPVSEAVYEQGETWCSTDHARLGRP